MSKRKLVVVPTPPSPTQATKEDREKVQTLIETIRKKFAGDKEGKLSKNAALVLTDWANDKKQTKKSAA